MRSETSASRPCDFCAARNAPFGYAPPPRLVRVRRPIWACLDPVCRAEAEARRQAAIERADPFARKGDRAPSAPAAQGSLF